MGLAGSFPPPKPADFIWHALHTGGHCKKGSPLLAPDRDSRALQTEELGVVFNGLELTYIESAQTMPVVSASTVWKIFPGLSFLRPVVR
jgi:hypothetical protein